jgi:hypothetical protein
MLGTQLVPSPVQSFRLPAALELRRRPAISLAERTSPSAAPCTGEWAALPAAACADGALVFDLFAWWRLDSGDYAAMVSRPVAALRACGLAGWLPCTQPGSEPCTQPGSDLLESFCPARPLAALEKRNSPSGAAAAPFHLPVLPETLALIRRQRW